MCAGVLGAPTSERMTVGERAGKEWQPTCNAKNFQTLMILNPQRPVVLDLIEIIRIRIITHWTKCDVPPQHKAARQQTMSATRQVLAGTNGLAAELFCRALAVAVAVLTATKGSTSVPTAAFSAMEVGTAVCLCPMIQSERDQSA